VSGSKTGGGKENEYTAPDFRARFFRDVYPDRATEQLIAVLDDPEQEFYHRVAIEAMQEIHRLEEAA